MTNREDLDVALAQAEAAREYLEAALVKAKAALFDTVTDASKIDANRDEASAKVEKARARCRQLRDALGKPDQPDQPDHSVFITRSRERPSTPINESDELSKREPAANLPSRNLIEDADHGESKRFQEESSRAKSLRPSRVGFLARERSLRNVIARSPLVRQTISLFALMLAYLAYFHADVQLQIMSLPSIVVLLHP